MPDFVIQHGEAFRDGAFAFIRGHKIERELATPTQYYLLGAKTTNAIRCSDPAADPCRRPESAAAHRRALLHVGVARVGGIGDDLMLATHCAAIKRRFPHAHITAFVRDNSGILAGHPSVDRIVVRCGGRWHEIVRDLRERFDLFYDLRYVAKVWAFHPDYAAYGSECRERFEAPIGGAGCSEGAPLAWFYHNWYDSNARLAGLGRHLIDLTNETICCPGSMDDVRLRLRPEDRKLARLMEGRRYAVVHNGAGGGCVAKKWPLSHWAQLVAALRGDGLEAVQVGWAQDELIDGALDLRGVTSLRETAGLIEGARVVVGIEGSIIHMAQAVRQRRVVALFGPTPAVCFAYPGHQVVETPLGCRGCWYANPEWHVRCPQGRRGFPCMEAIAPEQVMEAVGRALAGGDEATPDTVNSEAHFNGLIRMPGASHLAGANGCERSDAHDKDATSVRTRPVGPTHDEGVASLRLAVAIPTRDRPESLARLFESIGRQVILPDRILIVDDNREPLRVMIPRLGVPVDVIRGVRRGPARAHQLALEYLLRLPDAERPDLILRLDDDLVLESRDFIRRVRRIMFLRPEVGAAAGVYPQPGSDRRVPIERIGATGYSLTIEGMLRGEDSAQFHRWSETRIVEAEHLYSSFIYRREAAVAVGGFATWYSDQAQREETDFTHRLYLAGWKLLVDTGSVARHERAAVGGLRGVAREELRRADEALFIERLRGGALAKEAGSEMASRSVAVVAE
jgi:ADP-heptose:LPS heptosyltransferase/GT2 family glycosyltransferase